ncbi:thiamine pyrophosphate-dependent enzyme [Alkalimarinus coralli]|uniref:thiamine pyrophosphate-dependent enzyme n=1 Tax=Alkalimarinus coralli TaxID=2935863 RepID=UPI00202BA3B4|nr:thiamine pyrophosphate-dependent enzyme [Alkalimarinus coralli]
MQSRADIIDENFVRRVQDNDLPVVSPGTAHQSSGLLKHELVDLFESQLMSRHLDFHSRRLQARGESFYTIGSAGHEGNAACGKVFRYTDMAFLHYRSAALMLQRSKQLPGQTPLYDMMLSFAASSDDPISGGRHKVLGSLPLNIPPQTSTIASHLPKAVGTAFSIPLSGSKKNNVDAVLPADSVIVCNFGDASANHSTAQGAINAASWASFQGAPLPIVFICEDNGIGISTTTPKGWIAASFSNRPGLHYVYCNGLNLIETYATMKKAEHIARDLKKPVFVHMKTVRLMGHAGSDAEIAYRSQKQIEETESNDPLLWTASILTRSHILTNTDVVDLYCSIAERVIRVGEFAIKRPKLNTISQVVSSLAPKRKRVASQMGITKPEFESLFYRDKTLLGKPQPMGRLINWTLKEQMEVRRNIVVCGEDVAAKGGVYHVTHGLVESFGPSRVINTLLDEQSILGLSIGLAHNGFLPIAEVQFLAYVHNAEDQIRGEAATLSFFSNGQYSNPMVIRVAGLGYQKGFGGHFHNDNSLAVFRDIPGVVIACPSNGNDASKMLRSCIKFAWEQKRVVIFVEPIALYMTRDLHEEGDGEWSHVFEPALSGDAANLDSDTLESDTFERIDVGQIGIHIERNKRADNHSETADGARRSIVIISYANGYYLSRRASKILSERYNVFVKVIDLRWLSEIDEATLISEAERFENILVVDECRKTGSLSEGLMTLLMENIGRTINNPSVSNLGKKPDAKSGFKNGSKAGVRIERLTGDDCFVALGRASTLGMPTHDEIVNKSLSMISEGHTQQINNPYSNAIEVTP